MNFGGFAAFLCAVLVSNGVVIVVTLDIFANLV